MVAVSLKKKKNALYSFPEFFHQNLRPIFLNPPFLFPSPSSPPYDYIDLNYSACPSAPLQLPNKKKLTVPFDFPSFVLNPLSIKAFNFLYYHKQFTKEVQKVVDYDSFFYPLDSIYHWNRIYGKKGFVQYQFVLPKESSLEGLKDILHRISAKNMGSFLAVLKLFGKQESLISFPMEGFTLALDFPITKGLFPFLDELDKVVLDYGGRVYLTKDARLKPETLPAMYPHLEEFKSIIQRLDPEGSIRSLQSERLKLHLQPEVV